MTPVSGESPIAHPPMKCAVIGMFIRSPQVPPAIPPTFSASCRAAALAAGIQVGFGSPSPWVEVSLARPNRLFLRRTVIELLSDCMTSRMITRSDHLRGMSSRTCSGCRSMARKNCSHRCAPRAAVGEQGVQQSHRVAALAVADRLDVGVLVRVPRRRDRDTGGVVVLRLRRAHAEDRLGVGPGQVTEARSRCSGRVRVLQLVQQLLRVVRPGREDDLIGGERAALAARTTLPVRSVSTA